MFGRLKELLHISGRDAKILLLSFLLASSIWLIHNLTLRYSGQVSVPVRAVCNIAGHSNVSTNSELVAARCRTSGFDLLRLKRASFKSPITIEFEPGDLHMYKGNTYYVPSNELNKYISPLFGGRLTLEAFVSDTLFFNFTEEHHKKVPVQPVYSLSFQSQYTKVGDLKMMPDSIIVYGEPYHVDNIEKVYTAPFHMDALSASAHGEVRLDRIKGLRYSQDVVSYNLDVTRFVEINADVQIQVRNVPRGRSLIVYPNTAHISIQCPYPLYKDPLESLRVYVDYNDYIQSKGGQCLPSVENLPAQILEYKLAPQVFNCVEISI